MKQFSIIIEPEAQQDLQNIFDFITVNDTVIKAERFLTKLKGAIDSLSFMPERCRSSIYVQDNKTRDMIVSGYTICYQIHENNIHIVAVFRQRET